MWTVGGTNKHSVERGVPAVREQKGRVSGKQGSIKGSVGIWEDGDKEGFLESDNGKC